MTQQNRSSLDELYMCPKPSTQRTDMPSFTIHSPLTDKNDKQTFEEGSKEQCNVSINNARPRAMEGQGRTQKKANAGNVPLLHQGTKQEQVLF